MKCATAVSFQWSTRHTSPLSFLKMPKQRSWATRFTYPEPFRIGRNSQIANQKNNCFSVHHSQLFNFFQRSISLYLPSLFPSNFHLFVCSLICPIVLLLVMPARSLLIFAYLVRCGTNQKNLTNAHELFHC